jgi:DNA invertase Pin-like site-specific DNA recombinase
MARTPKTDALLAIGYLRVSTEDQALGLEAQAQALAAYAASQGLQLAALYIDRGVSGAAPIDARTGLLGALAGLQTLKAGKLLVAKRDRVARDAGIAIAIDRAVTRLGAALVSADGAGNGDTATDALMRTILSGMAEYERSMIAARTKAALQAKRARGEKTGGYAPYGYRTEGLGLAPVPEEQETIALALALRADGLSQRAVGEELAARGRLSRVGRPFSPVQVGRMLHRAA